MPSIANLLGRGTRIAVRRYGPQHPAAIQAIAEKVKPNANKVPVVNEIGPLARRVRKLADHCEARIAAARSFSIRTAGKHKADWVNLDGRSVGHDFDADSGREGHPRQDSG